MIFKSDFLWGASTSAYQVEGAYCSDGKSLSIQDIKQMPEGTADFKLASDHYHHFQQDIALFKELGLKAYRFSISWSRVISNGIGPINQQGLEFYQRIIDSCLSYEIEPIVTLYHFDLPAALQEQGGWSNRATIDAYLAYTKVVFTNFGHQVKYFITINEQNMMILHGDLIGVRNKSQQNLQKDLYQQNHHLLLASAKAINLAHQMIPQVKIGPAPNICVIYPKTCHPKDVLAAQNYNAMRNWLYLDGNVLGKYNVNAWNIMTKLGIIPEMESEDMPILCSATPDFIAFNYYNSAVVSYQKDGVIEGDIDQQKANSEEGFYYGVDNPNLEFTEFGWQIDPLGFKITLKEIYDRYGLPLLVSENGLGAYDRVTNNTVEDDYRIGYLKEHIEQLRAAVDEGVEVIGYCPWSAIDLISTHSGFAKRYGFIYVNRDDQGNGDFSRLKKKSFFWYQKVIKSNGQELE